MRLFLIPVFFVLLFPLTTLSQEKIVFDQGNFWSKDETNISVQNDIDHIRVKNAGKESWTIRYGKTIGVVPGDRYRISGQVKRESGENSLYINAIFFDAEKNVTTWSFRPANMTGSGQWETLESEFIVPVGVVAIEPRIAGQGEGTVLYKNCTLQKIGRIETAKEAVSNLENSFLKIEFSPNDETICVTDKRNNKKWMQDSLANWFVIKRQSVNNGVKMELISVDTLLKADAEIFLEQDKPELIVRLSSAGKMDEPLFFPPPFKTQKGERVILPLNEGIGVPVDEPDSYWSNRSLVFYAGHSLCMSFFGVTDDDSSAGFIGIVETPDDARMFLRRDNENLIRPQIQWDSQKKQFGYDRTLRFVFFEKGGHVALAKRYRQHAKNVGLLVTFQDKAGKNPNLSEGYKTLLGAPILWYVDQDQVQMAAEMRKAGFKQMLWNKSGTQDTQAVHEVRKMPNVLVSRYDNYQDVMDPANEDKIGYYESTWTAAAWPDEIIWKAPDGTWDRGWLIRTKEEREKGLPPSLPCGKMCDLFSPGYARIRIANDLKERPYNGRFIDTVTATPWNECWNPDHPMTRTDSKIWKMKLLELVGKEFNLVCGCETGHEAAVPYCDYLEGMMSLNPFRVPDSGRNMVKIWDDVPENVQKYQVGESFRLPLWELVFHDCCVATWYWGDYNSKLPKLWDKRDLFNALYGTPPMFYFKREFWEMNKDRMIETYNVATPVARMTASKEMTNHRILTEDRTVQQSEFANGVIVTVNFGEKSFTMSDGFKLDAKKSRIESISPAEGISKIDDEKGFVSIFNGNDLSEWEGNPNLWSVADGCIIGETAIEGPKKITSNTFLIWKGGNVEDFVLRFEARVTPGGNSGIQYRSWRNPDPLQPFGVFGYQVDFDGVNRSTGKIYGENYRATLAYRGTRAQVGNDHQPKEIERFTDDEILKNLISTNDWNSFEVVADGFTFTQKVNGHLTCILDDNDKEIRRQSGIVAIQLHVGPAMKVELRNLRIKKIGN